MFLVQNNTDTTTTMQQQDEKQSVMELESVFVEDVVLLCCFKVEMCGCETGVLFVEVGKALGTHSALAALFANQSVFVQTEDGEQVNQETLVEHNMVLFVSLLHSSSSSFSSSSLSVVSTQPLSTSSSSLSSSSTSMSLLAQQSSSLSSLSSASTQPSSSAQLLASSLQSSSTHSMDHSLSASSTKSVSIGSSSTQPDNEAFVVLDFDGTLEFDDQTNTSIEQSIQALLGDHAFVQVVHVVFDDNNMVTQVIVKVHSTQQAQELTNQINNIIQQGTNDPILGRITQATLPGSGSGSVATMPLLSCAFWCFVLWHLCLCCLPSFVVASVAAVELNAR